ncbi:hypothetical protein FM106_28380 [Brachybacterium faecium]|nr:hypothetical protein FM106_28380 [Brachybacterium faecium]
MIFDERAPHVSQFITQRWRRGVFRACSGPRRLSSAARSGSAPAERPVRSCSAQPERPVRSCSAQPGGSALHLLALCQHMSRNAGVSAGSAPVDAIRAAGSASAGAAPRRGVQLCAVHRCEPRSPVHSAQAQR